MEQRTMTVVAIAVAAILDSARNLYSNSLKRSLLKKSKVKYWAVLHRSESRLSVYRPRIDTLSIVGHQIIIPILPMANASPPGLDKTRIKTFWY